jgi:short subunit dehydrogenase-like uncharacterized protein
MTGQWMIYGAYGYSGKLAAIEAKNRGMTPVLAGRDKDKTSALAEALDLSWKAFSLDDQAAVEEALAGVALVLHCAGPVSQTSAPMLEACIASHCHYLDITGEIDVFAHAHSRDDAARRADVVVIPGVGFDVVPTDCLAATLAGILPSANQLTLAFSAGGGPSPGTAKTSVEGLGKGGRVRKDGVVTPVPLAWKTRNIPFASGERHAMTIPWGDVFTAFISTGIPNIEVFLSVPPKTAAQARRLRLVQPLLKLAPVQSFLKSRIEKKIKGPSDSTRDASDCQLWGEAVSYDGRRVSGTMQTPNGYELTVSGSLGVVEYLLGHNPEGGYYTPSLLMGPDYAASLPGVSMDIGEIKASP